MCSCETKHPGTRCGGDGCKCHDRLPEATPTPDILKRPPLRGVKEVTSEVRCGLGDNPPRMGSFTAHRDGYVKIGIRSDELSSKLMRAIEVGRPIKIKILVEDYPNG